MYEQVQLQSVSKRFFTLARDDNRWRLHCYEASRASEASSAPGRTAESIIANATASLSSLGEDSLFYLIQPYNTQLPTADGSQDDHSGISSRKRARAAAAWDPSFENEDVDWYSEYIARNGPIAFNWMQQPFARGPEGRRKHPREIKGLGLLKDWSSARQNRVVAPLDDGSICIWDLNHSHHSDSHATKGNVLGISSPGLLTRDYSRRRDDSLSKSVLEFNNLGECVSVDSIRGRAYLAVGNALNEVDLDTLTVVSQQRYPWSIFSLSQETDYSVPLTLATTLGLHIYDCRLSGPEEDEAISLRCENVISTNSSDSQCYSRSASLFLYLYPNGQRPRRIRSPGPSDEGVDYAPLFQPGPLSVLHPPAPHVNTILLAGRFPSVLSYDRRFFPRLQSSVHSGGRLCALASVPTPQSPVFSNPMWNDTHNVVACGEYNGRGSLELYSLTSSSNDADGGPTGMSSRLYPAYKNRQSAARSKLLSVASHGTRIVYSDADGTIKWVERDGRTVVRRWNINSDRPQTGRLREPLENAEVDSREHDDTQGATGLWRSAESQGSSEVARKILPTSANLTGDELLLWTGDRIGRLRFSIPGASEEEEEDDDISVDEEVDELTREEIRRRRHHEKEYEGMMRQALERQADEVRWMGGLGLG